MIQKPSEPGSIAVSRRGFLNIAGAATAMVALGASSNPVLRALAETGSSPMNRSEWVATGCVGWCLPEWIFKLSENDLKEFAETLQRDPEFYSYLKFQLTYWKKYCVKNK